MPLTEVPAFFAPVMPVLKALRAELERHELSPLEGALLFAYRTPGIDYAVIGTCSERELNEIILAYNKVAKFRSAIDFKPFAVQSEQMINPSLWK
jgi:aryl-alcohol dehydrogenase-like predicted oxidoreductase